MLNFPIPYPDELLYSAVARAGVHMGIQSPKQLLDEVFEDRHVIATVDLPNHLEHIAHHFPAGFGLSIERLAYGHTLFPVYAPFTVESRRRHCLDWMGSDSRKAIHMTLGLVASRVKQNRFMRYCSGCLQQMLDEHGEYHWSRRWQVEGADCCLEHGVLIDAKLERHSHHRHQFVSACPDLCPMEGQKPPDSESRRVTRHVNDLFDLGPSTSPAFSQWSAYYKVLAIGAQCNRGQQICYDVIKERVLDRWSGKWLKKHGLMVTDEQACWLRTIFRKHRKSFSYLEHIVVFDSLLPEKWCIRDVLRDVARTPLTCVQSKLPVNGDDITTSNQSSRRSTWLNLIRKNGVTGARLQGGGALYAWLYRHDRSWLLSTNKDNSERPKHSFRRVDWHVRDILVVRKLTGVRKEFERRCDSPRRSRNWFLSKLEHPSSIEKHLAKLPVTRLFFKRYCEDVSDYQVRRITALVEMAESRGDKLPRWRVLRMSGLSEKRLTDNARYVLDRLIDV